MKPPVDPRTMRRTFIHGLFTGLRVVWPVLSGLLATIAALGLVIGLIEGWSVQESIYFAFVSGLTIGYGDFAPRPSRRAHSRSSSASAGAPDRPGGSDRRQGFERGECRRGWQG